jgi:hypothetical protein
MNASCPNPANTVNRVAARSRLATDAVVAFMAVVVLGVGGEVAHDVLSRSGAITVGDGPTSHPEMTPTPTPDGRRWTQ